LPTWTPRHDLAVKRLQSVLKTAIVACDRTLEQKIADAGPFPQRIDPHILTEARHSLTQRRIITSLTEAGVPWFALTSSDPSRRAARLTELVAVHRQTQEISHLIGQALEIATYRSLLSQGNLLFFGQFTDLDDHDDSTAYVKVDPPTHFHGGSIPGKKRLDFLVSDTHGIYAGVEVKNVRQWFHPNREEIRDLLLKCCALDVVPVLIARRIQYSSFSVLNPCGVVIHETFNQLYPASKSDLAVLVRDKHLLGFHDVRCNSAVDAATTHRRLDKFLHVNLPALLPEARESFNRFKDLLWAYATGKINYKAFAARVKRRTRGQNEDFPDPDPTNFDDPADW
jgi:hypothetical protein